MPIGLAVANLHNISAATPPSCPPDGPGGCLHVGDRQRPLRGREAPQGRRGRPRLRASSPRRSPWLRRRAHAPHAPGCAPCQSWPASPPGGSPQAGWGLLKGGQAGDSVRVGMRVLHHTTPGGSWPAALAPGRQAGLQRDAAEAGMRPLGGARCGARDRTGQATKLARDCRTAASHAASVPPPTRRSPRSPTVSELLLFHTGAPELVVQCGLLNADEGRYCTERGGSGAQGGRVSPRRGERARWLLPQQNSDRQPGPGQGRSGISQAASEAAAWLAAGLRRPLSAAWGAQQTLRCRACQMHITAVNHPGELGRSESQKRVLSGTELTAVDHAAGHLSVGS